MKGAACLLAPKGDPFAHTLALELAEIFETVTVTEDAEAIPPCHLAVIDLDLSARTEAVGEGLAERRLGYSRREHTSLPFPFLLRPFAMADFRAAARAENVDAPAAYTGGRLLLPDGSTVLFTEREDALFRLLYEADGRPLGRDLLAATVFPDAAEPEKSLNVYIHYLRKKIERNGQRVILSHRGGGYSLRMESLC